MCCVSSKSLLLKHIIANDTYVHVHEHVFYLCPTCIYMWLVGCLYHYLGERNSEGYVSVEG